MATRILLKATRQSRCFVKGQKLWVIWGTGALAAYVACRFQNKGRWIRTWAHWADPYDGKGFSGKPDCKWIGEVEVSDEFEKHLQKVESPEKRLFEPELD